MAGILDLDLNAVTDPNQPAPDGTYRLEIKKAEKKESDTGSVGVVYQYSIVTPGEHQGKTFGEYVNVIKKDGTENKFGSWRLKQDLTRAGVKKGKLFENLPALIGQQFDAELVIEEPAEDSNYGPQNAIKRILK